MSAGKLLAFSVSDADHRLLSELADEGESASRATRHLLRLLLAVARAVCVGSPCAGGALETLLSELARRSGAQSVRKRGSWWPWSKRLTLEVVARPEARTELERAVLASSGKQAAREIRVMERVGIAIEAIEGSGDKAYAGALQSMQVLWTLGMPLDEVASFVEEKLNNFRTTMENES